MRSVEPHNSGELLRMREWTSIVPDAPEDYCLVINHYGRSARRLRRPAESAHFSPTATSRQHGFVKRYGLVRDDRHEAPPIMVPFRRSPARPFAVLPHHRLGVLPLGSP